MQTETIIWYHYTPIKNGQNLEHWQHQILARVWNNKNSLTLLVGMQNDTAMLEDTLDVTFLKKIYFLSWNFLCVVSNALYGK